MPLASLHVRYCSLWRVELECRLRCFNVIVTSITAIRGDVMLELTLCVERKCLGALSSDVNSSGILVSKYYT